MSVNNTSATPIPAEQQPPTVATKPVRNLQSILRAKIEVERQAWKLYGLSRRRRAGKVNQTVDEEAGWENCPDVSDITDADQLWLELTRVEKQCRVEYERLLVIKELQEAAYQASRSKDAKAQVSHPSSQESTSGLSQGTEDAEQDRGSQGAQEGRICGVE